MQLNADDCSWKKIICRLKTWISCSEFAALQRELCVTDVLWKSSSRSLGGQ